MLHLTIYELVSGLLSKPAILLTPVQMVQHAQDLQAKRVRKQDRQDKAGLLRAVGETWMTHSKVSKSSGQTDILRQYESSVARRLGITLFITCAPPCLLSLEW